MGSADRTGRKRFLKERYTVERCYVSEWWNSNKDKAVSLARVRVEPGVCTELHRLRNTTERYLILSGRGRIQVGTRVREVEPGDVVMIAPDEAQRITNTGSGELGFIVICTPRFRQNNYEAVAETEA